MKEFRERVLVPLLVPLLALAVIVVVVLNISRILLALEERSGPHTVVVVALIIAAAVLFGFTYASSRNEERSTGAMSLLSVAGILVVIAGFIGYEAMAETQGEEAAKKKAAAQVSKPDITVEAFDIGFKVKDFKIGPGNVAIQEVNTGATAHTFILEGVSSGRKLCSSRSASCSHRHRASGWYPWAEQAKRVTVSTRCSPDARTGTPAASPPFRTPLKMCGTRSGSARAQSP